MKHGLVLKTWRNELSVMFMHFFERIGQSKLKFIFVIHHISDKTEQVTLSVLLICFEHIICQSNN